VRFVNLWVFGSLQCFGGAGVAAGALQLLFLVNLPELSWQLP